MSPLRTISAHSADQHKLIKTESLNCFYLKFIARVVFVQLSVGSAGVGWHGLGRVSNSEFSFCTHCWLRQIICLNKIKCYCWRSRRIHSFNMQDAAEFAILQMNEKLVISLVMCTECVHCTVFSIWTCCLKFYLKSQIIWKFQWTKNQFYFIDFERKSHSILLSSLFFIDSYQLSVSWI